MYYSEPRYTKDLDVVVGSGVGEVQRVADALAEFGFPMTEAQIAELAEPNQMIVIGRPPHRIDILNELTGVNFDEAWQRRKLVNVNDQEIFFLSLDDLISAKRAAGRPQDKLDLKKLAAASKRRK